MVAMFAEVPVTGMKAMFKVPAPPPWFPEYLHVELVPNGILLARGQCLNATHIKELEELKDGLINTSSSSLAALTDRMRRLVRGCAVSTLRGHLVRRLHLEHRFEGGQASLAGGVCHADADDVDSDVA
jgi:hypothetical protein